MAKRIKDRFVTSISIKPEQKKWLEDNELSLTDMVQKMLDARMSGIYDDNREEVMEVLWDRFRKLASWPHVRTVEMVHSWLNSAGWSEELKSINMTPQGFFTYVRRRVEQDPDSPRELRISVGLEKAKPFKMPSDAQLAQEKADFLEQGKKSKGLHIVREDDDAKRVTEEEATVYGTSDK